VVAAAPPRVAVEIEDTREGSGHLQVLRMAQHSVPSHSIASHRIASPCYAVMCYAMLRLRRAMQVQNPAPITGLQVSREPLHAAARCTVATQRDVTLTGLFTPTVRLGQRVADGELPIASHSMYSMYSRSYMCYAVLLGELLGCVVNVIAYHLYHTIPPYHTTRYHAMPCHAMPCHAMPCLAYAMLCYATLCHAPL
jgi:hypothetical protein